MDNKTIKTAVAGVAGRMGATIARLVVDADDMELAGVTERPGHEAVGKPAGDVIGTPRVSAIITDSVEGVIKGADVYIDFTSPEATLRAAQHCAKHRTAHIVGTTGMTSDQRDCMKDFAKETAIMVAPNMSLGVNLLASLVERAAAALGEDYDIEIVEAHHRMKADAPSGTALMLARTAAAARGMEFDDVAVYGREGKTGERPAGQIGVMTLRGGDIVGDHTVMFAGPGERLELTHRAHSRETFARGALRAARWAVAKKPGLYSMMDVLGLG